MYPDEFQQSLSAVEKNRKNNLSYVPNRVSQDEKRELLCAYHPAFKSESFDRIKIGANKGDLVPLELCALLQTDSTIKQSDINLDHPTYDTDVLIIGGGGAGAAAAIEAARAGAKVLIATALRFGVSNTIMAKGGIQAAVGHDDSPELHFLDSFSGGNRAADKELLGHLVSKGPDTIKWLTDLGVQFDKTPEGTLSATLGGGVSKKRILSAKDSTGAEIMRALRNQVQSLNIDVLEFMLAVELILDPDKKAAGAILQNAKTQELSIAKAKAVIIATGGAGQLRCQGFPTSNHAGSSGDGLRLGYRAGARLVDAESFQYHPTGAFYPSCLLGTLITEKARALGAKLINRDGKVFVNPLETRDVCAAAIIKESLTCGIKTPDGFAVWLDTPMIEEIHGSGAINKHLPKFFHSFKNLGIDIRKEPVLVYPTLHYQNGGLRIDKLGLVKGFENLYAAGEVAGGIHGKNRLMGNSLLDIIVFGREAGKDAAKQAKEIKIGALSLSHIEAFNKERQRAGIK